MKTDFRLNWNKRRRGSGLVFMPTSIPRRQVEGKSAPRSSRAMGLARKGQRTGWQPSPRPAEALLARGDGRIACPYAVALLH